MHHLGYVNHFDVWVQCKLSKRKIFLSISTGDSLLKCNKNVLFLKQIVTDNEKWIKLYNKVEGKRLWGKQNKTTTSHTKGQPSSKDGYAVYVIRKGVLYMSSFRKTK